MERCDDGPESVGGERPNGQKCCRTGNGHRKERLSSQGQQLSLPEQLGLKGRPKAGAVLEKMEVKKCSNALGGEKKRRPKAGEELELGLEHSRKRVVLELESNQGEQRMRSLSLEQRTNGSLRRLNQPGEGGAVYCRWIHRLHAFRDH